jgi:hypothetical protein
LAKIKHITSPSLEDYVQTDNETRRVAMEFIDLGKA